MIGKSWSCELSDAKLDASGVNGVAGQAGMGEFASAHVQEYLRTSRRRVLAVMGVTQSASNPDYRRERWSRVRTPRLT